MQQNSSSVEEQECQDPYATYYEMMEWISGDEFCKSAKHEQMLNSSNEAHVQHLPTIQAPPSSSTTAPVSGQLYHQ